MKRVTLLFALLISGLSYAQITGSIVGKLIDKEFNNEPLAFVNVLIKGTVKGTTSDIDGLYILENLKPGDYIVVFSFIGYETQEVNATVAVDKRTTINLPMFASAASLSEVVITTTVIRESEVALLIAQKKAVEIKQSIGIQELARKGLSNVEDAVSKSSGITKVASRGVVVRGLDERYNYLTINNLPISPINWESKIPDLGLFSSFLVSKIDINKIFYSGLYGDFAGATFNVDTKKIPAKGFTKISFSVGANFQSLDNTFIIDEEDGTLNLLGFGGVNDRPTPDAISNANSASGNLFTASGQEAVNAFTSDFDLEVISAPISSSFSVANAGIISKNGLNKTAYYIGVNSGNSFDSQIGESFLRNPQGQLIRTIDRRNSFNFNTNSSLLFSIFNRTEKNNIDINYLFVKSTSNNASDNFGRFSEVSANLQGVESKFVQSTLHQTQVVGAFKFNEKSHLNYATTIGFSNYEQPDNTVVTLEENDDTGQFTFSSNSGRLFRFFLNTDNNNYAANINYQLDILSSKSKNTNRFQAGFDFNNETLDVFNRFVLVNLNGTGSIDVEPNNIDNSVNNAFLSGNASLIELPDTPFIDIQTTIFAGNASYNLNFSNKFSLLFGLRLENFVRIIGEDALQNSFEFDELFILPSFNLKYTINEKSNFRFAGSQTYTRPKNIEIVPITRQNSLGDLIQGNTGIDNSDNFNFDLKYEIFPDSKSLFSLNLFSKFINNPIERLIEDNGSFIRTVFDNTDEALLFGAEFEFQTTLGSILQKDNLKNISFGANVTLLDSEVTISDELQNELNLTNNSRRLQGASDFLLNADVNYNINLTQKWESRFTFLFNTFSERISAVGSGVGSVQFEDEFEQPFNNLSFIWSNKIGNHIEASLKLNNILNDTYKRNILDSNPDQDRNVSEVSYQIGTSVNLSFSYKF